MPILTEAYSVIIKDSSLREKYIHSMGFFFDSLENQTYCTDGEIHSISFLNPKAADNFIKQLEEGGLEYLKDGKYEDIALIDMLSGPFIECNWLGFLRRPIFSGQTQFAHSEEDFSLTWFQPINRAYGIPLNSEGRCIISTPSWWTPEKAIYTHNFLDLSDSN